MVSKSGTVGASFALTSTLFIIMLRSGIPALVTICAVNEADRTLSWSGVVTIMALSADETAAINPRDIDGGASMIT